MKKKCSILSLAVMLICLAAGCGSAKGDTESAAKVPDNLMASIYAMSDHEQIMQNHKSFLCKEDGNDIHGTYYQDSDTIINDFREDKGFIRIHTRTHDGCLFNDGTYNQWVGFEEYCGGWGGLNNDVLFDEIQKTEEKNGLLTVTTIPSEKRRKEIIEEEYADVKGKDKITFRNVYVLSADTLELQSVIDYDTMPDGKEVEGWKAEFTYDVESPFDQEVAEVEDHLAKASKKKRTTTLIFNPDTESECRYVYQTPVGDACNLPEKIVKNNIQYQIDKEKSIPTNEAKDNDAAIYLVPID